MTHKDPTPTDRLPPATGVRPEHGTGRPDRVERAIEQAIDTALAQPRVPAIRPDFAERVAHLAVQQQLPARLPRLGWGPSLALLSGLLLTIGMFVVAPHAVPTLADARFDTELVLLAELSGLLLFAPKLLPGR